MVEDWDDDGSFESVADQPLLNVDLTHRNPFDLSTVSYTHLRAHETV